jgi:hypothetical protein
VKTFLIICILFLSVSTWAERIPTQRSSNRSVSTSTSDPIPFVTEISPREAPSGAVIHLNVQSGVPSGSLLKYRLAIGGVTARFFPLYKDDWTTIGAIVPYNIKVPGQPARVPRFRSGLFSLIPRSMGEMSTTNLAFLSRPVEGQGGGDQRGKKSYGQ